MNKNSSIRLYAVAAAVLVLGWAAPASAQFKRRPLDDRATGEKYHIEAGAGLWNPTADMSISSESLGIPGDDIDFKKDLGLEDQTFRQFRVELRPAAKHKLRFQYIPLKFDQEGVIERNITFNGQLYTAGLPVNTTLDWKAYRFTYEYDFISRNRISGGFVLDFKHTDVEARLDAPSRHEFTHAAAPIPAIGGVVEGYVTPNISITGEFTGLSLGWIPRSIMGEDTGNYFEADVYGTINFTRYIGAQLGYRSLDLGYSLDHDTGSFKLKGLYFGVVARY